MKDSAYYKEVAAKCLMNNYGTRDIVLVRGEGSYVWDAEGKKYLDFLAGISVNNIGHGNPAVAEAICAQARQMIHCSNLYLIPTQVELAARLCELSFAQRCFFANSGAEANEGAIKLARLYSKKKFGEGRYEIITLRNSFHGRTIATITATGQEKVQKGFEPLVEGFRYALLNDIDSVRAQITDKCCAIMFEPVQGEGGVLAAKTEFLKAVREECDKRNLLLIFDEVQCGMGRCGKMFAHQLSGVEPDIMTLAKAVGGGLPLGAMLTRDEIAEVLGPGSHGTTFGGNPVACAAGLAVVNYMVENDIPARAERMGSYLRKRLAEATAGLSTIKEIRGAGLLVGVELTHPGAEVVKLCLKRGLIINCTMGNILRLLPPLTVSENECDEAAELIGEALRQVESEISKAACATTGCCCGQGAAEAKTGGRA